MRAYASLLGVLLLSRLAAMVGFSLLILPGLVAVVLLSLGPVIMIAERPGVMSALG